MEQRKIYLEKNRNVKSVNKQSFVNINLSTKSKLLPYNSISDVLNLNNLYINERNNCSKYRIILNVNPICTNVLYNARTEVVRHEGGDNAELLIGTDKIVGISDLQFTQIKDIPASGAVIDNNNIRNFVKYTATAQYESGDSGIIKDNKYLTIQEPLTANSLSATVTTEKTNITPDAKLLITIDDIIINNDFTLQQEKNELTVSIIEDVPTPGSGGEIISGDTDYGLYIKDASFTGITNSGDVITTVVSGYSFTPFSAITMSEEERTVTYISAFTSNVILSATTTYYDSGVTVTSAWSVTNRNENVICDSYTENMISDVTLYNRGIGGSDVSIVVTENPLFEERNGEVIFKISGTTVTGVTALQQDMKPIEVDRIEVRNIVLPSTASTVFPDRVYNVPAKGGTLNYNTRGVSYEVIAYYNNATSGDVTTRATVSGSQTVASKGKVISNITTPAKLKITAEFGGKTANSAATIYQQENRMTTTSAYTETTDQKVSHYGTPVTAYTNEYIYIPPYIKSTETDNIPNINDSFTVPYNARTYYYKTEDNVTDDSVKSFTDTSGTTEVYETWSAITTYNSAWTSTATAQTKTWVTISGETRDEEWTNQKREKDPTLSSGYDTTMFANPSLDVVGFRINNGYSSRTGTLTYKVRASLTKDVTFTQEPTSHSLSFHFNNNEHTYSGDTRRILAYGSVESENVVWTYSGDTEWLAMRPLTGRNGTTSVVLDANANTTTEPRVARFYVVCRDEPSIYDWGEIYQEGKKPTGLTISNLSILTNRIPASGGMIDCAGLSFDIDARYNDGTSENVDPGETTIECTPVSADSLGSAVTTTLTNVGDLTFEIGYEGVYVESSITIYQEINRLESGWTASAITNEYTSGWTVTGSTEYDINVQPVLIVATSGTGSHEVTISSSAITPVTAYTKDFWTEEATPYSSYTSTYIKTGATTSEQHEGVTVFSGSTQTVGSASVSLSGNSYSWASATPVVNELSTISYNANDTTNRRSATFTYYINNNRSIKGDCILEQEKMYVPTRTITIQPVGSSTSWNIEMTGNQIPIGNGSFTISAVNNPNGQIIGHGPYEQGTSVSWDVSGSIIIVTDDMTAHSIKLKYVDTSNQSYHVSGIGSELGDLDGDTNNGQAIEFDFSIPAGTTDETIDIYGANPNLVFGFN